ncbi:ATP-binding protein [Levilactobacillus tujiorum]|uniref:ATP-binding protein n=1 Tax=Levilactobacillus tujiorum TaxID=2912243 RepID=A0ABX1LBW9_9LACO|nr:ATP-binding protein [Levilactobacillus tujiorum]MCH5465607.1 ATP-binding protein [Levilactobacillus tujiorum]NLR12690.1 ATP-binding protein [Lactobacillus sp. HBUAS51387]NLR30590.1 ATP-binding protein [Levilactobacillus tujiorum]
MDREELNRILDNAPNENEKWDFKAHWHEDKGELLRDILNFANTVHHENCYIIFGVSDDGKIIGVEDDSNRRNRQNVQDFLRGQKFSQSGYPLTDVATFSLNNHKVDVLTIFDTSDIPFFLEGDYKPRNGRRLQGGLIYSRINDSNTPRDQSTTDAQMEKMWKKRFRLDVSVKDRFGYQMLFPDKWSKVVNGEVTSYVWNEDSNYVIKIVPDSEEESRVNFEAFSYSQVDKRIGWDKVDFIVSGTKITYNLINYLDGARLEVGSPDLGVFDDINMDTHSYYYLQNGRWNSRITKFLYHRRGIDTGSMENAEWTMRAFKKDIVIYDSEDERKLVEHKMASSWEDISNDFIPTKKELDSMISTLKSVSWKNGSGFDWNDYAIQAIEQHKIAQYINEKMLEK